MKKKQTNKQTRFVESSDIGNIANAVPKSAKSQQITNEPEKLKKRRVFEILCKRCCEGLFA